MLDFTLHDLCDSPLTPLFLYIRPTISFMCMHRFWLLSCILMAVLDNTNNTLPIHTTIAHCYCERLSSSITSSPRSGCMNTEANLNIIIYTSGAAAGYRVDIMTSAKQYLKSLCWNQADRRERKKQFFVHEKPQNRAKTSNVTLNWTVVNFRDRTTEQVPA